MSKPIKPLVIENISKHFGGLQALDGVDLTIEPGERRVIIGPNGAGKTTLFNLISGVLTPSSGRIYFLGRDITQMAAHRRAAGGLGRTFQITSLFPKLTVLESVLLAIQALDSTKFGLLRPISSYKHVFAKAREFLEEWRLWDMKDMLVRNLSYGQKRKVDIFLAMVQRPKLLLLDEPTGGLSLEETNEVISVIQSLPGDNSIVLIEHDMDVAFQLADWVTVLYQGKVVAEGSRHEVRQDPMVREIYLGAL